MKHDIGIFSPYKIANLLANGKAYLCIQQTQSNISIYWKICFWPPDQFKEAILCCYFLLISVIYIFCSCKMSAELQSPKSTPK